MLVPPVCVIFVAMVALTDTSIMLADAQITGPQAQSANNMSNNQGALNQEQSSLLEKEVSPTVKITYPEKGQEVPVGELTVNGISSDTMDTDCEVFVILNGIKPYQPVSPTDDNDNSGEYGSSVEVKDYATWTYNFTPKYTLIREGENKITSKIACQNGQGNTSFSSNLKHYSVNVTGFDNISTTSSSLLPQNTSETLNTTAAVNNSDTLNNATIFVVPVPSDLFPQIDDLDGNGLGNLNDNSEGDENNGPDNDEDDSNNDNGGGPDNVGKGKGKAKGHDKNKS